jgi:hypothetical protein
MVTSSRDMTDACHRYILSIGCYFLHLIFYLWLACVRQYRNFSIRSPNGIWRRLKYSMQTKSELPASSSFSNLTSEQHGLADYCHRKMHHLFMYIKHHSILPSLIHILCIISHNLTIDTYKIRMKCSCIIRLWFLFLSMFV